MPRRRRLPIGDRDELLAALEHVDEPGLSVLKMRHGLAGTRLHNLHETAKRLGVSREQVRHLEDHAIATLRAPGAGDGSQTARTAGAWSAASRVAFVRRWTLVLLTLRPAHVYELRKRLVELGVPPASYRTLYELEAEGLVSSTRAPGVHAGRDRRVYTLTELGRIQLEADREMLRRIADVLDELLEACPSPDLSRTAQAR